jgi:hypothetical protein
MTDWKDSLTDWERLGGALREVFPRADHRSDKKIAKAWNNCFAALRLVLDRHVPGYDFERFDTIMAGERMLNPEGSSKKDRRILSLFAVTVSIFSRYKTKQ